MGSAAAVAASFALSAQAETNLAGETVEWTIPFSGKGGSAKWANFFAPLLSEVLPGQPTVVVRFMPGAQCLASCVLTPGSSPAKITIEHPTGSIEVLAEYELSDDGFRLISAGLIRTARKLADGNLYIPASIWENQG